MVAQKIGHLILLFATHVQTQNKQLLYCVCSISNSCQNDGSMCPVAVMIKLELQMFNCSNLYHKSGPQSEGFGCCTRKVAVSLATVSPLTIHCLKMLLI